jgi:aromatic ring-opening dioxygenase LigB subunit
MPLIGAFVVPHGSMILDAREKNISKNAIALHDAMVRISNTIASLKPDLIFLTSPHGIALSHNFGIYLNAGGSGSAEWEDQYKEYKVRVKFDQKQAHRLLGFLDESGDSVSGISAFTTGADAPLRWGEAVPLWFLRGLPERAKYVIMSQPMRRYDEAEKMIDETLTLGRNLRSFFESIEEKVIAIISADLGHTHSQDGPYGFSETAKTFDNLIERWASTLDEDLLLRNASRTLKKALCCGYVGFVILQGMLEGTDFRPNIMARSSPTYYGMMVVEFIK